MEARLEGHDDNWYSGFSGPMMAEPAMNPSSPPPTMWIRYYSRRGGNTLLERFCELLLFLSRFCPWDTLTSPLVDHSVNIR